MMRAGRAPQGLEGALLGGGCGRFQVLGFKAVSAKRGQISRS